MLDFIFFPRNMGCQPRHVFTMCWEGCEKDRVPFLKLSMLLVIDEVQINVFRQETIRPEMLVIGGRCRW